MATTSYRLNATLCASATVDFMAHHSRTYSYPPPGYSDGSDSPPPAEYAPYSNRGYPRPGYYPPIAPSPGYRSSSSDYPPESGYSSPPYANNPPPAYPYSQPSGYRPQSAASPPPRPLFIPTPSDSYASHPIRPASAMQHHPHRPYPGSSKVGHSSSSSRKTSTSTPASSPTERFVCDVCHKDFSRAHDRKRHFETQHSTVPTQHKCRYCEKDFSRADSLKRHLQNGCDEAPQRYD